MLRGTAMPNNFRIFFNNSQSPKATMVFIGKCIIGMLSPLSSCQNYLSQLVTYIEPYYHPSNNGDWTGRLGRLLKILCTSFTSRVSKEKKHLEKYEKLLLENPSLEKPSHFKNYLTDDCIDTFIRCMVPIVIKGLYSKNRNLGSAANISIKNLAFVRPNLVLPELLESIIPDLQLLEQTHRIQAALEVLGVVTRPLIWRKHYPEGAKHLSNLLCLTLPGIDPNDLMKTLATLRFYSAVLINVPLFDCTLYNDDDDNSENNNNLSEDDKGAREASGYLADWAIQFLEKSLVLYYCSITKRKGEVSLESAIHTPVKRVIELLFQQASPLLFDSLLQHLFNFVISNHLSSATTEIGDICGVACFGNPEKTLDLFLPHHYRILIPDSSNPHQLGHLSQSELEWILTIILKISKRGGKYLLKHRELLENILTATFNNCKSRKIFKLCSKLLRSILSSLTEVYLTEYRSFSLSTWNSDEFKKNAYKYWGDNGDIDKVEVQWHYPSNEELEWATSLINNYGNKVINQIENFINDISIYKNSSNNNNSMTDDDNNNIDENNDDNMNIDNDIDLSIPLKVRKEVWHSLYIIRMILHGSSSVLKVNIEKENLYEKTDEFIYDKNLAPSKFEPVLVSPTPLCESNIDFTSIGIIICKLTKLLQHCDDTQLLKLIVKIMNKLVNTRYSKTPEVNYKSLATTSYAIGSPHLPVKKSVRYFMVQRAFILYSSRLFAKNYTIQYTNLICELLFWLLRLSVNRYSKVRAFAQRVTSTVITRFSIPSNFLNPQIISYLAPSSPPNCVTGSVYLLHCAKLLEGIVADWSSFNQLIHAVSLCYNHSQPTVQNRVLSLFEALGEVFNTVPITCKSIKDYPVTNDIENLLKEKTEENIKNYYEIITNMTSIKLPWNYTIGIGNILMLLIRDDYKPPPCLIQFFLNNLTSTVISHRRLGFAGLSRILLVFKPIRPRVYSNLITKNTTNNSSNNNNISNGINNEIKRISVPKCIKIIENIPNNSNEWENAEFQDKNCSGWAQLPLNSKIYCPLSNEDHENLMNRVKSIPGLNDMLEILSSSEWWDTAILRLSAEANNISFMKSIATFFKGLFQVFYDNFLDILIPKIKELSTNYQEKGCQVLACHMIAGLVRGSKHWPYSKIEKVWDFVIPLFETVLEYATSENIGNWIMCINFCVYDRDPRRLSRLLNNFSDALICNERQLAILQSKRIQTLSAILAEFSWKGIYFGNQYLEKIKDNLCVDRKLIRNAFAVLSAIILSSNYDAPRDKYEIPSFDGNNQFINSKMVEFVNHMVFELERTKPSSSSDKILSQEELELIQKDHKNCCKFILSWIVSSFQQHAAHTLILYLQPLLPKLLAMRDEDKSVMNLQYTAIGYIANTEMTPSLASNILNICCDLLQSPSWHTRATILPFMQVLVFKNIFLLKDEIPSIIKALVSSLEDPQLEVRDLASTSLAGLLKFSDNETISKLKEQFLKMSSIQLPKIDKNNRKFDPSFSSALRSRHGGVLGLAALARIHPYEIPDWLPELLVTFATHINDPMPIKSTVKKTFLEFWKVHQDAWAIEKTYFTNSQLTILTELLVSPSYFA